MTKQPKPIWSSFTKAELIRTIKALDKRQTKLLNEIAALKAVAVKPLPFGAEIGYVEDSLTVAMATCGCERQLPAGACDCLTAAVADHSEPENNVRPMMLLPHEQQALDNFFEDITHQYTGSPVTTEQPQPEALPNPFAAFGEPRDPPDYVDDAQSELGRVQYPWEVPTLPNPFTKPE